MNNKKSTLTPADEGFAAAKFEHLKFDDFCTTDNAVLLGIVNGEIDPVQMAKNELVNRGLGEYGEWIGFAKANKTWKEK